MNDYSSGTGFSQRGNNVAVDGNLPYGPLSSAAHNTNTWNLQLALLNCIQVCTYRAKSTWVLSVLEVGGQRVASGFKRTCWNQKHLKTNWPFSARKCCKSEMCSHAVKLILLFKMLLSTATTKCRCLDLA